MSSRVSHTTFSCLDAFTLSEWWKTAVGYADIPGDPNEPGDPECAIVDRESGHVLLFLEVDELPPASNRVHLDLVPRDRTRDEDVYRLVAHGAPVVADHRSGDGLGWVVLADPIGNLFCVLRSDAERLATGDPVWPQLVPDIDHGD